jgi:hypothetical protein
MARRREDNCRELPNAMQGTQPNQVRSISDTPNLVDLVKSRLGRYYKILVPFLKVKLGLSLEGKSTPFVIKSSKKEPKKFFRAQVYDFAKLVNRVRSESDAALQKDELRELLETLPLLLMNIAITREKWLIGKIENHPFDIFIAPERFVEIKNKNVNIYRGLHIQTKRLYQHLSSRKTLEEWVKFIQATIEEKIAKVDFGFNGHIHFYNMVPLTESVDLNRLKKLFKKMYVPYNKYVDSISVSVEIVNQKKETTVVTWYIYPLVSNVLGVLDLDLARAKKIYMEEQIFQMMRRAILEKERLNQN